MAGLGPLLAGGVLSGGGIGIGSLTRGLGAQNGYHAQMPGINQVDFAGALKNRLTDSPLADQQAAQAQALWNRGNVAHGQEQQLIGQLQGDAAGNGPGTALAQSMLHQATDQNIAQNAGMLASQKGLNPALAARMAGQNAGSMNQQAAAQGTQMALAQQLQARQQLGGILNNQQALDVNGSSNLINTGNEQHNQLTGMMIGGNNGQNSDITNGSLGVSTVNSGVSKQNASTNGQIAGGLLNSLGGGAAKGLMGGGGGGAAAGGSGGMAGAGDAMGAIGMMAAHGGKVPGNARVAGDSPKNDTVKALLSPGEVVVPRTAAHDPEKAAEFVAAISGKKAAKDSRPKSYGEVLKKLRELEAMIKGSAA